jgi:hypothetical protein
MFVAFMDLEKAYDRIDRQAMWDVLMMYGVGGKVLSAIKSMYEESVVCVRIGQVLGRKFRVDVGLRQGCVTSPWLFNIFIVGVVREVNSRVMERGVALVSDNDREWQLNQILYADDTALVTDEESKLQSLVTEFRKVCERRKLSVNVAKSKVMRVTRRENADNLNITVNGVRMEVVECFRYLGVDIDRDGGMKSEMKHRASEGEKVSGVLRKMWKGEGLLIDAKRGMYEGIVAPLLLYGSEVWETSAAERRRMEVMEMKCMRAMCGVSVMDS